GGLHLPHFEAAGLGNLHPGLEGVPPAATPTMAFGRMREASAGKDSTTGHWEIAGLVTPEPFATFPAGFPDELVEAVSEQTGHEVVGNRAASGTVIIEELGRQHLETGSLILYTSADSVFQIAAHKDVIGLDELYRVCEIARRLCDPYRIGRVIARPFEGKPGAFRRTYERRDYAMPPPGRTVLDAAAEAGMSVVGIGKIGDLFVGRGITDVIHTQGDAEGLDRTQKALADLERGLIMTNLVDLDMVYGHREDPAGFAQGLRLIDAWLPDLTDALGPNDLLFLTADHGNDPTDGSTDHTRELVPLLVGGMRAAGVDLGVRDQFCDVAATIAQGMRLAQPLQGRQFLEALS
ncbi:MAG TPA: phosphopentomutase, partial [Acidimicrobiia bacterium]